MDILKSLAREASQVEVVQVESESTALVFEANRLKTSTVEETRGLAARVVRHGRLGFAATADLDAVDKFIANVLESAAYGEEIPLAFSAEQPAVPVRAFDSAIAEMPIPRLVELGAGVIDSLLQVEPEARINLSLNRGVQNLSIRTSAGADISFQRSPLSIELELARVEQDDILITFELIGATVYSGDLLAPVHALAKRLQDAKNLVSIRTGNMPVLFSPAGALALLLPLGMGLNGKNVLKGVSPLAGKLDQPLFDPRFTLVDDATLDGRFASASYDDEGVPHRRNVLIENGVLRGFVYDLKTAAQAGVASTGNGSRSLFRPPDVEPTHTIISPGDQPLREIIASIDEGLLVEDLLGIGQGNILSGAFSNPLSLAFKIEKGEIVGRVKDVTIAGDVYELLKDIAALSQESRWVYNIIQAPYILLPAMNVVGKQTS